MKTNRMWLKRVVILFTMATCGFVPITLMADVVTINGADYDCWLSAAGYVWELQSCSTAASSITVPTVDDGENKIIPWLNKLNEYPNIKTVVLEPGIENIYYRTRLHRYIPRQYAFHSLTNLTNIVLPNTLKKIGASSFYNCRALESITIPDTVVEIGESAFAYCVALNSVYLPNSISQIQPYTFRYCSFENIELPKSLEVIGSCAFQGCNNLTQIIVPDSVHKIDGGFYECTSLETVTLPNSVTNLQSAFNGCKNLEQINLPKSVVNLDSTFANCWHLKQISIPDSVKDINYTFSGCLCLKNVKIPNSVTSIGNSAFNNCIALSSITIPSSVTNIGEYAFSRCDVIKTIAFKGKPPIAKLTSFRDMCTSAIGTYTSDNAEYWEAVIDNEGYWNGLKMVEVPHSYVVSFDTNGGKGYLENRTVEFGGDRVSAYSSDALHWENHVFMGWAFAPDGEVVYKGGDTIAEPTDGDEVTLYAVWSRLRLEPESVDWNRGSLTLLCSDADPLTQHTYTLRYFDDSANDWKVVGEVVGTRETFLKDESYLSRLDGIAPVKYSVTDETGQTAVCQTRNRHGIFVGLNEWDDPDLKPIGGDTNANEFSSIAMRRGGFFNENIYTLTNEYANADAVDAAFDDVAAKAKPGDVCLFYFSTHGGVDSEDAILCLYDEDYTDKRMARKIAAIDSGVAIVGIISACHSGGLYDTNPLWDEWYVKNNLAQCSPNIAWLSSSDVANTAYGVFDKFLLEYGWEKGWAGTDEMISFNDLASYTKEQYDTLFSGTILKGEKRSKTAQIEDTGGLLSSIVAGRRGGHETSIRKPSAPNNVDVKTGLYLNQLDVTLQPVADADEYCIFLLCEDGSYEKIWTPSAKHLQTIDVDRSSVILSNKEFSDTSLQVLIKAVNGAGVSQAVTSERKELVRITFDGNGGEVGNWRGAEAVEVSTGYFVVFGDVSVGGELLTLPSVGTYSVAGYEFKGWFDENGIEATPETEVSQSIAYYARWESSTTEPEFNVDENGALVGIDYGGATEITLPDTVTSIAGGAFGYNSELERVTIPANVNSIHAYAFDNCSGLISITVAEDNPYYKSANELLLTKDGKTLVQGVNGDVIIPSGVTKIGDSAFYGCSGLTSVAIPKSVTTIEVYGFSGCTSLASIIIPSNVVRIDNDAFSDCEALESVEFEGNRDDIEMDVQNVFYGTPWLISTLPKPENDNHEAAILLSGNLGRITGTNVGATPENIESELGLGRATIWWKWSAPASYEVAFDTLGSLFDTILGVYVETANGLVEIAYNDDSDESNEYESRVSFNAEKGTMYYIVASGYGSNMGTIFLSWEPYSNTPIPEVTNVSEIESAFAGSTDTNLVMNITSVVSYDAYRTWATGLEANYVSALAVKRSPYSWLSFALGVDALINKELTSNDVKIQSFTPASTDGKFEFTVSVKDVNIGGGSVAVETLKENLKKVLAVEGAATLSPGGFSSDNIDITFDAPVDGKARFAVTPPADAGNSFFMRVKVK